jgi:hypothetical protein
MRSRVALITCLFFSVSGLAAQDFIFKKPFDQWSAKDTKKVLEDSAWTARESTVQVQFIPVNMTTAPSGPPNLGGGAPGPGADATASPASGRSDATGGETTGREASLEIWYQAQIRSALPVRQAMVRQAQIEQHYDALPPEKKSDFDQQSERLLKQDFKEHIVVAIHYGSNVRARDSELARYWQTRGIAEAPNNFSLIGSGGRIVRPMAFQAAPGAGRELQVVFPRTVDGEPIIGPDDDRLVLEFTAPEIQTQKAEHISMVFKVKKMLNGRELIL